MEDGTEVRLYDPKREPPKWTGIVLGTECAVFLSDVSTSGPLSRKAKPFPSPAEGACVVFAASTPRNVSANQQSKGIPASAAKCSTVTAGLILRCW